ncbi:MAG: polymerase [Pseudomonadota bacterium]|jgi:DNA polymerase-1
MTADKALLLVDGSSYLYRAFHALPDLRNREGEPTGAIYGIVAMLRRLRADGKLNGGATHGAVVFDAPGKTFRDDLYPQYKAQRSAMPEDLRAQIPMIHRIVRALGWPLLMIEGIEADDVIGTLAEQAGAMRLPTVVSTGDKDMAQLVNEHVRLVNTMTRDSGTAEWLDREGVIARFGVPPERIIDWLTLVGDSVDNVPGVDKVGPKTAVKLLSQYGSLDALVEQMAEVKGVVGENLRAARDWLPLARTLVTIRLDCDLGSDVVSIADSLGLEPERDAELLELFGRCGFRTWTRELEGRLGVKWGSTGAAALAGDESAGSSAAVEGAAPASGAGKDPTPNPTAVVEAPTWQPAAPIPLNPAERAYETVLDQASFERWLGRIHATDLVAFDTETTSLDPMQARLVGLSLSVEPGEACYIPVAHTYAGAPDQLSLEFVLGRLRDWLEDETCAKVGQNLKYDAHVLENHGITLRGIAHDTLLQSYVLEAHRNHDMDSLANRHLDRRTIRYEEVAGKGAHQIGFDQVPIETAGPYAAEDAEVTLHLHRVMYPRLKAEAALEHIYRDVELPVSRVLQRMERHGVLIDAHALSVQSHDLGRQLMALEQKAHEAAGQAFNLGSTKQLGEILFGQLGLPVVKKTAGGAPSTDEEVLAKLAEDYPLPKLLLEWRGLSKLKSTYTDKLPRMVDPRTGRVHTSYSQAVAVTGRLSSSEPNLQNIPVRTAEGRRIREAFIAPPGCRIVSADYSQIELRIMAHLSRDEGLLTAFARGQDVHRATAAEIFGVDAEAVTSEQRRYAKVINFGLIYGMSAFGLAANLGIERDAARNYIERYFARYPGVRRYMDDTRQRAHDQGYVETVFGRRLWLAEINGPSGPRRAAAERAAINAPMQGTAADLIKMSMIVVQRWLDDSGLASRLVMQVHDELVLEVPEDELEIVRAGVCERMSGVAQLDVPLLVEAGAGLNWEQAH